MARTVIDPHVHLWDLRGTPRRQTPLVKLFGWSPGVVMWLGPKVFPDDAIDFFDQPDHVLSDYLPRDYALDTAAWNVEGVVHVEAGWEAKGPMGPVGETGWLEEIADPWLLGIVGKADLTLVRRWTRCSGHILPRVHASAGSVTRSPTTRPTA
ncbi:MAG: hypothetical protein R3343_08440 [Nitriliruptorales bacterium]|nr:hypothetical protein [Nitriliruptorales bacterium]